MHGLLSISLRELITQRTLSFKAVQYFSKNTGPLQCSSKIGKEIKEVKNVVQKNMRKYDPFVGEQNEPAMRFAHHFGLHGFELYPIQVQVFAWTIVLSLIAYYASAKIEIVFDRSYKNTPFIFASMEDRDGDYVAFGYNPRPPLPRLHLLERLQGEMIEEAKRRGTRK